jgi:hypothetical protein
MIVRAFGIPTLTCSQITTALKAMSVEYGTVIGGKLEKYPKSVDRTVTCDRSSVVPIVFDSPSAFLARQGRFKVKVLALIIGDPVTLGLNLGLPCLGVRVDPKTFAVTEVPFNTAVLREILRRSSEVDDHVEVSCGEVDITGTLLKSYSSSVLPALQGTLYRIKDREVRTSISRVIHKYLCGKFGLPALQEKIFKLTEGRVSAQVEIVDRLSGVLSGKEFKIFRQVVRTAYKNPSKINALSKKHKISAFDIRYILAKVDQKALVKE